MELYEAINKRKTVREWQKKDVPEEMIKRIINAGLKAPTHNHMREWDFILLHLPEEKEKTLQFAKVWTEAHGISDPQTLFERGSIMQRMYIYAMPRQYSMLLNAPYLIIPLFKTNNLHSTYVNELNSFSSIWCMIENMFLAATAEGLACSMRIPVGKESTDVLNVLSVPGGYMMPCYIGVGYPAENASMPEQISINVEKKIHCGKW